MTNINLRPVLIADTVALNVEPTLEAQEAYTRILPVSVWYSTELRDITIGESVLPVHVVKISDLLNNLMGIDASPMRIRANFVSFDEPGTRTYLNIGMAFDQVKKSGEVYRHFDVLGKFNTNQDSVWQEISNIVDSDYGLLLNNNDYGIEGGDEIRNRQFIFWYNANGESIATSLENQYPLAGDNTQVSLSVEFLG